MIVAQQQAVDATELIVSSILIVQRSRVEICGHFLNHLLQIEVHIVDVSLEPIVNSFSSLWLNLLSFQDVNEIVRALEVALILHELDAFLLHVL